MKALALVALLVAVASASSFHSVPPLITDFTANITIKDVDLTYTGYIIADITGQRTLQYIKEMNETTFTFQAFNEDSTYAYTMMNSGCTCQHTSSAKIPNIFASLAAARQSSDSDGCTKMGSSGTLYTNNMLQGLPAVPQGSFCISGSTAVSVHQNSQVIKFTNFKAGRPSNFPLEMMNSWINACSNACL